MSESTKECPECGDPMEYVEEPLTSGFRGYLCKNEECPRD